MDCIEKRESKRVRQRAKGRCVREGTKRRRRRKEGERSEEKGARAERTEEGDNEVRGTA